jgi:two-component system cell cycle response regulator
MLRLLIVEDEVEAAELVVHSLQQAGLDCTWEQVASERDFRGALARLPDVILSDSNIPGFDGWAALSVANSEFPQAPFIFVSGHFEDAATRRALANGAAGYVGKTELERLPAVVRFALGRVTADSTSTGKAAQNTGSAGDAGRIAVHLLERRAILDKALRMEDRSAMSNIMRRIPPLPVALVMMESASKRDRFIKILHGADVEVEQAQSTRIALASLESHTHALLFTDSLGLIRNGRLLHAGAATHMVYIERPGEPNWREALRAGANASMPEEPCGEEFWAQLTIARRIISLADSLQLALTDNRVLSTIDELTRCGSRRFFEHQFPREVERAVRVARPLSLLMCDIDHFKSINDTHGHETGDEVLREFTERLTHRLRLGEDWVARVGGDEFVMVLPEIGEPEACAVAERLRERISATEFSISGRSVVVTASFGVCGLWGVRDDVSALTKELVKAADLALYESKRLGRNRITAAPCQHAVLTTTAIESL